MRVAGSLPFALGIFLLAFTLTNCGSDETVLGPGEGDHLLVPELFPDSLLYDAWVLQEGEMLPDVDPYAKTTAFEIDSTGHANIYFRDSSTLIKDRVRSFALLNESTLVFDLAREPGLSLNPARTSFYPVVVVNNDFLGLADDEGRIGLFAREPLPDSLTRQPLTIDAVWTGLPTPHLFGDLLYYQGDLIYNSNAGNIERFDLGTETLIAPLATTSNRFLITMQTSDRFWSHCGCGGSPDATLRDLGTIYDTVSTGDLGFQITIRAGEYNSSTGYLWLHGYSSSASAYYLLTVNAAVEPDVLVSARYFNRTVYGMAFDGTYLWMILKTLTPAVALLDPNTFTAFETYEVPDETTSWYGITVDGIGNLYMLGSDSSGQGVIVRSPNARAMVADR